MMWVVRSDALVGRLDIAAELVICVARNSPLIGSNLGEHSQEWKSPRHEIGRGVLSGSAFSMVAPWAFQHTTDPEAL